MPDGGNHIVKVSNQELQTMPFGEALEYYVPDLASALPDHIPLDRFKRVVLTAVNQNPELARADRRSLFNSCSRCAHDGLYPDGREAALVIFRTRAKRKVEENGRQVEKEFYADLVQYMPMIAGIRKRMRNTGAVLSADAQIVCRNDKFHYEFGDDPKIVHEPPPLGAERGETIGAYAIIKLANGEVLREVMGRPEIERVRAFSRAKDGPAWTKSYDEMARKTVLRRCSKAAPTGSDIERMLAADEHLPQISSETPLRELPARPQPDDYREIDHEETLTPQDTSFQIVDFVGESVVLASAEQARDALLEMIQKARSPQALYGLWESNGGRDDGALTMGSVISDIAAAIEDGAEPLFAAYETAKKSFQKQHPGSGQDRPVAEAQRSNPAQGASASAATGHTEHPEGRGAATPTERSTPQESQPTQISQTETSRSAPRDVQQAPRDEAFWSQKEQKLPGATAKEILYYAGNVYLRQCRDGFDINAIELFNDKRPELSPRDQRELAELIAQRRSELERA